MIKSLINRFRAFHENRQKSAKALAGNYIVMHGAQLYPSVTIGRYSYIAHNTVIDNTTIGNYTSIGPNCTIGFGDHPIGLFSVSPLVYRNDLFYDKPFKDQLVKDCNKSVTIGHDVWIGANVVIRNGVIIGNGAIVGAGSVVLKDIEPFTINYGIPCTPKRNRFSEAETSVVVDSQWWDLSLEVLADKVKSDPKYQILQAYRNYKV